MNQAALNQAASPNHPLSVITMSATPTLSSEWLEAFGGVDWSSFRTPEALQALFEALDSGAPTSTLRIPLPPTESGGDGLVFVLGGDELRLDAAALLASESVADSISGSIRRISLESAFGGIVEGTTVLNLSNLELTQLFTVLLSDLSDDEQIGDPTIALINSKLFIPANFIPISLGEEGDGTANGEFFNIGTNETLTTYFPKFFSNSSLNSETGVLSTESLSINLDSVQLLGYAGTNPSNQSLSGFDYLNLIGSDEALNVQLPAGGLFLTTGGGSYPLINTSSGYTVGRGQPGLSELTTFALQAYPGAGSTGDATVLKFSFTPGEEVKSLILDLVFASDEYPEYANSSYVDIGAIWFDNQVDEAGQPVLSNYAQFDNKPLSVVTDAITDPRFINNNFQFSSPLPIEFDGITKPLKIAIPLAGLTPNEDGSYTINIGIADSGDTILDSALWISNLVTDKSSIGGTFLPVTVNPGGEYIAPPDIPVYATLAPGSTFGPSEKTDFAIVPKQGPSTIKGTGKQFNGDQYEGVGNETEFEIQEEITEEQVLIEEGSAIITLDTDKNGFDSNDPKFTLLGDYFDVTAFSVTSDAGKTIIKYNGPTGEYVAPTLAISGPTVDKYEGAAGSTLFSFTITRSGDTTLGSTVLWAVEGSGQSPANAKDFVGDKLPKGEETFEPGESTKTIEIEVAGDFLAEADDQFTVTLSDPTGAEITSETTSGASATILNDDLIGTKGGDKIIGTTAPEFLDGLAGSDKLTGRKGPDIFGFRFGQSTFSAHDRITDWKFGEDKIQLLSINSNVIAAPKKLSRAADINGAKTLLDAAKMVFSDADGKTAKNQKLGANSAALVNIKKSPIAGTYLMINDNKSSFSATNDLLINLSGLSGKLLPLGPSAASSLFVA
jgi:hypothetical protein